MTEKKEITLTTGKAVTINRPTIRQRIEANDAAGLVQTDEGMMINNSFLQACKWAAAGLGVSIDDLDAYTDVEIAEIAKATRELAELDPTKG